MKFRSLPGRRSAWEVLVKHMCSSQRLQDPCCLPAFAGSRSGSQLLCAVCPGRKEESTPLPLRPLSVASSCLSFLEDASPQGPSWPGFNPHGRTAVS